ncbi:MAG: hypothetical protein GX591_02285 [Planctomycetes bacterium]|nr:hypothetical protein [Planctomycetota bacterium]
MNIFGVVNINAGQAEDSEAFRRELRDRLAGAGLTGEVRFGRGEELAGAMTAAAASGAEVLLAGGGDGTIHYAAQAAVEADMTLAVLPMGTINLLARDLGLPVRWREAVDVLPLCTPVLIDTAEVNGHPFLSQSTIGLVPRLARQREQIRGRGWLGGLAALPVRLVKSVLHARKRTLELRLEDHTHAIRTWMVVVTNNRPDKPLTVMLQRSRLDRGCLTVHWSDVRTRAGLLGLLAAYVSGCIGLTRHVATRESATVEIASTIPVIDVAVDGEILRMASPLRYRIHPRSLRVLMAPRKQAQP